MSGIGTMNAHCALTPFATIKTKRGRDNKHEFFSYITKFWRSTASIFFKVFLISTSFVVYTTPARANFINVQANVVVLEATYMPRRVRSAIDQPLGDCRAQTWLDYLPPDANADNANAVYGMLMVALTGKLSVRVFDRTENNEPGQPCTVDFIHLDPR